MEFCMSIFSPRNFNDIPQSVCVKEVWEGGMRGEKPCYYATRTISTHAIDDFLFPVVPTSFVSLFMAWQAYQATTTTRAKQRYLPRKSFWPHFDTSHNFTKTSPDNLSGVLTFKYALIPPSWKIASKGFVEFNKTMRRILTSLLCYSLYFSEGFEWVNSSLQHSIRIWDLWWGKAELGGLKLKDPN